MVAVGDERNVDAAQPALVLRRRVPGLETVLAIRRGEDDGATASVQELFEAMREGLDLSRADEGPGFGEEDQDEPVIRFGVGGEADVWWRGQRSA